MNNVVVHDSITGEDNSIGTLASGACGETLKVYRVTAITDLCNGSITNEAYASGDSYCGEGSVLSDPDSVTIPTVYNV